jgi:putative flippase GtrA
MTVNDVPHSTEDQTRTDHILISLNTQASRVRSPNSLRTNLDSEEIQIEEEDDDSKQSSPLLKTLRIDPFGNTPLYQSSQKVFNEALRFQISGLIGSILFFIMYEILFMMVQQHKHGSVISWLVAYMASIWWQFELHRWIVYGKDRIRDYWAALRTTFAVYSISLVISTILNYVLTSILVLHFRTAWIITMIVIGVFNYFMMRAMLKVG